MAGSTDRRHRRVVLTIMVFLSLGMSARVQASPRSAELIGKGSDLMATGRFDEALAAFDAAAKEDSTDAEALFFAGVALNRLGRSEEALARLRHSAMLGFDPADLDFELGWALLKQRQWDEAIERLERFEQRSPGRGQTSEFLGRAYLARGEHDRAAAAFDEALRRDPSLAPTVGVYQALLQQRRGDEAAAGSALAGLVSTSPESVTGRFLRTQLRPLESLTPDRRWWLGGSFGAGHSSDARGIPDLFPGINDTLSDNDDSAFFRTEFDAGYLLIDRPDWRVSAGYDLLAEFYAEQQHDPDLLDQTGFLLSSHRLSDTLAASLRLWDNYTLLGEDELRNQIGASASIRAKVAEPLALDASYSYSNNDYLFATPEVLDRDADTHTLGFSVELAVPGTPLLLRGGYFHAWNFADGADFAYESDTLFVGLAVELPWELRADFTYLYSSEDYAFRNSASAEGQRRNDDIDSLRLRVTRRISRHFSAYVQYDLTDDESNVEGYGYEQHVIAGGIVWRL